MRIGMFDSGIGGLSVLHEAFQVLPTAHYIYYGDTDHVPYGEKTEEQVKEYVTQAIEFLISQKVDAILIACNTATTVATQEFRAQFHVPIVGMEPAVKKAVELYGSEGKRILVAATPITINGQKLHTLLEHVDTYHNVDLIALPKLVHFAEQNTFESSEIDTYLSTVFDDLNSNDYSALVLGCTHFNYFKHNFKNYFGNQLHFVDGNLGTLQQLIRVLPDTIAVEQELQVDYYYSGRKATISELDAIHGYMKQLDRVHDM